MEHKYQPKKEEIPLLYDTKEVRNGPLLYVLKRNNSEFSIGKKT